ncbi:MAG: heme exporter protein CcmD [Arenimonas sp.]|jgi:hypothetical protein
MSHWFFITLAYSAFIVLLLWDFLAPQRSLKGTVRAIRLQQRKSRSA